MSAPSMSLSCSASSVGCHAPHHCTTVVQFLLHVYGGGPTELDASLGMVCREPGRVNAHRGLCVCGDETQEQQRTVSSRMLPSDERTRGGSHAADADTLWKKLARRTHPQHDEGPWEGSTRRSTGLASRMPRGTCSAGHSEGSALESGGVADVDLQMRCQRCGAFMDLTDPGPGQTWTPDQFWTCLACGRHFWTTYPAQKTAYTILRPSGKRERYPRDDT